MRFIRNTKVIPRSGVQKTASLFSEAGGGPEKQELIRLEENVAGTKRKYKSYDYICGDLTKWGRGTRLPAPVRSGGSESCQRTAKILYINDSKKLSAKKAGRAFMGEIMEKSDCSRNRDGRGPQRN